MVVDGNEIGTLTYYPSHLTINFFGNATPEQVAKLVHDLTYQDPDGALLRDHIFVSVTDAAGRTATSVVHVAGTNLPPGATPTGIVLSGGSVLENADKDTLVGFLSAQDADIWTPGASLIRCPTMRTGVSSCTASAAGEERRVTRLRDSARPLDQAAGDGSKGHSFEKAFTIAITDVPDDAAHRSVP